MNYRTIVAAAAVVAFSTVPAFAQGHPTATPVLCNYDGSAVDQGFFSEFVNIGGGLYWTGGANPPDDTTIYDETGLRINTVGVPARTVTMQYQLGRIQGGAQDHRASTYAYVDIYFTDGSNTYTYIANGAHTTQGFTLSPTSHGFVNLTWNAALAGKTGKFINKIYFTDYGPYGYENESFEDFVTRVYVNGILAAPLVHEGFEHDCSDE